MIEKFTFEELEQIRKELSIPVTTGKRGKRYRQDDPEWVSVIESVLSERINGMKTPLSYSPDVCHIMFLIVDSILANYAIKRDSYRGEKLNRLRVAATNTVRIEQQGEYEETALEVANALKAVFEKHEKTRNANLERLLCEADKAIERYRKEGTW